MGNGGISSPGNGSGGVIGGVEGGIGSGICICMTSPTHERRNRYDRVTINPSFASLHCMNTTERRVLEYVHSIKGGPTKDEFDAVHGPVGSLLLTKLVNLNLLREGVDSRVHLTGAGSAALAKPA